MGREPVLISTQGKEKIMLATASDLTSLVGRRGTIDLNSLTVNVSVRNARHRYGHVDLLISPDAGSGEQWVEARRVTIAD
jgi:hypothetical protein